MVAKSRFSPLALLAGIALSGIALVEVMVSNGTPDSVSAAFHCVCAGACGATAASLFHASQQVGEERWKRVRRVAGIALCCVVIFAIAVLLGPLFQRSQASKPTILQWIRFATTASLLFSSV